LCLVLLVYVAFDILYNDDNQSLINLPMRVRQHRLAAAV
jgi:ATP-dependent DNA ligase